MHICSRRRRFHSSNPQNRDENIDCYVAKLDELVKKFGVVVPAAKQETLQL
jgi:hypothetical protein